MEIKEVFLNKIEGLVSFSSSFFISTRKDGTFDALKFCQKLKDKGNLKIFVSQINNQNIGYISLLINKENKIFDIGPMFILPEYSGKGYGKDQVNFILSWAKENNFLKIETRTWGQNIGSRKIFESFDFIKIKEIENDRIDGDSSVYYEKLL